jgi:hypothetical protein
MGGAASIEAVNAWSPDDVAAQIRSGELSFAPRFRIGTKIVQRSEFSPYLNLTLQSSYSWQGV